MFPSIWWGTVIKKRRGAGLFVKGSFHKTLRGAGFLMKEGSMAGLCVVGAGIA
ncbi:hypothetical protein HTT03_09555 [Sulfitobacter sp. S0837]|nr:hypothetical protein [Sulfitobacter maritimus]